MKRPPTEWTIYRTRFLVKAKQLTQPMSFIDRLGREHSGQAGDYLVEWSDGSRRVAPRHIFEDIYVAMESPEQTWLSADREVPIRRRVASRTQATV